MERQADDKQHHPVSNAAPPPTTAQLIEQGQALVVTLHTAQEQLAAAISEGQRLCTYSQALIQQARQINEPTPPLDTAPTDPA